jgi:hypothetical protein
MPTRSQAHFAPRFRVKRISHFSRSLFEPSVFILLTLGDSLEVPEIRKPGYPIRLDRLDARRVKDELPVWTDDYSNVATLLAR